MASSAERFEIKNVIQVGQVLDKYELLERVGQGGMAIVYRGIDRTLKRVVAIKVLHRHLADYQEARDRFEREAQAVAKLRHENILEIYDYAAKAESEAYIVTEFIDGQTLKQVVTDRPIAFPEIGAMLVLQVCRALAHAHAGGILHRDVKPENIMIRSDGVVKLMDFGISHMVDLERLTVTGQLLGSPAYMAPEHVEGRRLDFRTDVFAAGIVLYQMCVGRLPFEGKNPHEVLKRIAECKFNDPRTANPRIGNRLGRIILRAMAREPADRYAAIGEMVTAIEGYLDESGIATDKIAAELARYFAAPGAYEAALVTRLVDHLTRTGQKLLDGEEQSAALDVFDRVLTIEPNNEKVISILDRINRRATMKKIALAALAAAVIGGGAFMIHKKSEPPGADSPNAPDNAGSLIGHHASTNTAADDKAPPLPTEDAGVAEPIDASVAGVGPGSNRPPRIDAGTQVVIDPIAIVVKVTPISGSEIDFGDGKWVPVTADGWGTRVLKEDTTIRVRNACCVPQEREVTVGQAQANFDLRFKAAKILAVCDKAGGVRVWFNEAPGRVSDPFNVLFDNAVIPEKVIDVRFIIGDADRAGEVKGSVRVRPGDSKRCECDTDAKKVVCD